MKIMKLMKIIYGQLHGVNKQKLTRGNSHIINCPCPLRSCRHLCNGHSMISLQMFFSRFLTWIANRHFSMVGSRMHGIGICWKRVSLCMVGPACSMCSYYPETWWRRGSIVDIVKGESDVSCYHHGYCCQEWEESAICQTNRLIENACWQSFDYGSK